MASTAAVCGEPPAVLLLRRLDVPFTAALSLRFRLLDFYASGAPLPAFLAAAAAMPNPPSAAVVGGSGDFSVLEFYTSGAPLPFRGGGNFRVDAAFFAAVPSIRCVVSTATGLDHIDLAECAHRGVAVANVGSLYATDVADHAVGLLLDVLRRVSAGERYVWRGLWPVRGDFPLGSKLGGKRVGLIGLGGIGSLIAKRLEAFGCVIYYHSRRPKESVPYKYFPDVRDLAAQSDVLVVSCALSDETRHIVDKDVLEALGKDGSIVNIARGANVDEVKLVGALKEGKIAGAGLDVFENEPYAPEELFSMDSVVLTPHRSVWTSESRSELSELTIGNLEAFFSGEPLLTPVLP